MTSDGPFFCLQASQLVSLWGSAGGALLLYGWLTRVFGWAVAVSLCWFGTNCDFCGGSVRYAPICLYPDDSGLSPSPSIRSSDRRLVVIFQLSLWVIWPNLYGLLIGQLLGQVLALFVLARVWPLPPEDVGRNASFGGNAAHCRTRFSFRNLRRSTVCAQFAFRKCPDLVVDWLFRCERDRTVLAGLPDADLAESGPGGEHAQRSVPETERGSSIRPIHAANDAKGGPPAYNALRSDCCGSARRRTNLVCMDIRPELGTCGDRCANSRHILDAWNVSVPASIGAVILGLQRSYFLLELVMLGVRAVGICIGALLNSSSLALILFSAAAGTSSIILMAMVTVADRRNHIAIGERGKN